MLSSQWPRTKCIDRPYLDTQSQWLMLGWPASGPSLCRPSSSSGCRGSRCSFFGSTRIEGWRGCMSRRIHARGSEWISGCHQENAINILLSERSPRWPCCRETPGPVFSRITLLLEDLHVLEIINYPIPLPLLLLFHHICRLSLLFLPAVTRALDLSACATVVLVFPMTRPWRPLSSLLR
jgi:hypothetical protein